MNLIPGINICPKKSETEIELSCRVGKVAKHRKKYHQRWRQHRRIKLFLHCLLVVYTHLCFAPLDSRHSIRPCNRVQNSIGEIGLHTKSKFNRLLLREEKIFFNLYFHSSHFARRFNLPVEIIGVKMEYHIFVNGVLSIIETEAHFGQNRPKSTIIGY